MRMSVHEGLMTMGFERATARWDEDGQKHELWAKATVEGPIVVTVVYPKPREVGE